MISAIAARKAALEQQQRQQQQQQPQQETTQATQHDPPTTPPPRSPKRKNLSQLSKPPPKKQKRSSRQSRNDSIPTPTFPTNHTSDTILIESDEEDESASQVVSEDSDSEVSPLTQPEKRGWSPGVPLRDSSEDEDVEMEDSQLIDIPRRFTRVQTITPGGLLSSFVPVVGQNTFSLSRSDVEKLGLPRMGTKGTIVVLKPGEKMCLLGTCKLTLLCGGISINGAVLRPSRTSHSIFALRSYPLPVLEWRSESSTPAVNVSLLPPSLQSNVQTKSVIFLEELGSGVEGLGRVCRTFEGVEEPTTGNSDFISAPFQIDGLYLVKQQTRDICPFVLPDSWSKALSIKPQNPVFLVKGSKKCGKSVFSKTLLNTLLARYRRVAFLECDLGQSEFTPGGMVALNVISYPVFGPPFTHPSLPLRAHYIGSTTPRSSPSHYLDAIQNLMQAYRLDVHQPPVDESGEDTRIWDMIPLVVNTMGWSKGLGADLTQRIEEIVEPGQVFEFQTEDNTPSTPNAFILEPIPPSSLSTNFTAADHRTISLLSYFHAIFPTSKSEELEQVTAQTWNTSLPLCAMPPYEVDIRTAVDEITLTGAGSEDVVPEEISRVLNGAIVGLVKSDNHYYNPSDIHPSNDSTIPYTQNQPVPLPSETSCIGLALIRALDPPLLHILTPVPPRRISGVRSLVKGEMELPVWGMLDFRSTEGEVAGVEKHKVPYLQWGRMSEGAIGGERKRFRRNLMRRGQA